MSKTVGEYQLKEKIGKGSYADVYKGTHKVTGLKYAIKTISKDILSEPKLLAGLESEIKIMREFVHENIVCLHEYFSSEKNFYLVLELCEGGDLSKFIKKKKRIDERLAHNFLTQITSGLAFLHEKNFIHRDLKPANVLLSEFSDNAVLKLADFGFARQLTVASLAQTRCGTPLYMAPEILESKDYDGKADIWSVGCIFYEMLVGTSPFKGANEGDLLMNIKTKELNVPKDVVLSEVSIQILIKLLERHPIRRASLPQLVALCVHMNNNPPPLPPGSSSSGAGGEEVGLALPVPSPTTSETKHNNFSGSSQGQGQGQGRGGGIDPNDAPRRRSSGSIPNMNPSEQPSQNYGEAPPFISPVKASPQQYTGGPAVSNLRGMFSPAGGGGTDTHTPPPSAAYHERGSSNNSNNNNNSPIPASYQETQNTRRGSSSNNNNYDPQKTVRAPYANPNTNKYPSPSSSPPSGSMSVVGSGGGGGYSMQTSHARSAPTHGSAPVSTSPGTIGMMGNLIAYVFNPSPSPPSVMQESSRAHAQYKQQQYQHGRSISLDRATPPSFGHQYGGGTPPPAGSSRARAQGRSIREDHFAVYSSEQDSMYNGKEGGGSELSVDDDFVMIHNSSSERADARANPSNLPSQQASQTNSASTSSYSGSGGNSAGNSTLPSVPQRAPSATQSYHLDSEVRNNEFAAMQALYASTVQKCQVYCAVASSISALGDQYVYELLSPQQQEKQETHLKDRASSMDGTDDDDEDDGIAGFLQQPQESRSNKPQQQQAAIDRCLTACSLYLHALGILANLLKSIDTTVPAEHEQLRVAIQKLKSDVGVVFEQLIARASSCQVQIDQLVNPHGSTSVHAVSTKYTMPQPEPVMVQAALKRESDAAMEELLGNLNLASKLYASANELVEGVALTSHDQEDQRKLQLYSASLLEKHRNCKKRAEELLIFS